MSFNVVAFQESQDEAGVYSAEAAVADTIARTSGDQLFIPPETPSLFGAYAATGGTVEGAAYLSAPSLLRVSRYDIYPCQEGIKPSGDESIRLHPLSPLVLAKYEPTECRLKSDPAAAEVHTVLMFLAEGPLAPVTGEIHPVKFTAAITETVGAWKAGDISFDTTLPVGKYRCVGAMIWGTSGVAFRFIPKGFAVRPGFISSSSEGNHGNPLQRYGGLGVWFEFDSLAPPQLEWLAVATSGTAQTGVMDLLKVS